MSEVEAAPQLPHDLTAEQSVLGALLYDANTLNLAVESLRPGDFYLPAHREIFAAALKLNADGMAVDLVTVEAELRRKGSLAMVGGADYLVDLTGIAPTTVNSRYYIRIVREKSTLRQLIDASARIRQDAMSQQDDVQVILNRAEKEIFDISMSRGGTDTLRHIGEAMMVAFRRVEELERNKGGITGVPTGFVDLDKLLTGLHGGELVLIGARPSMGKTSFAMNICTYAALKKKQIAVSSLEMPREQIALRMLCGDARVNMQSVRQGTMKDDDWTRLARSLGPLSATEVYIDDTAGITPSQLRSRCRRMMMEHGLDMIVIDYLQLMVSDSRNENRQQEVSEISRSLKGIAQELRVPLVACAQLSRANTQRSVKRPVLSDLRDSGSIEQDADVVMFLHRESYYNDTGDNKNVAEVIVAKQRNGPLGTVQLAWLGEYTLFDNLSAL